MHVPSSRFSIAELFNEVERFKVVMKKYLKYFGEQRGSRGHESNIKIHKEDFVILSNYIGPFKSPCPVFVNIIVHGGSDENPLQAADPSK